MLTLIIDFLMQYIVKLFFAFVDNSPDWLSKKIFRTEIPRLIYFANIFTPEG
jgi:hypothetical protein